MGNIEGLIEELSSRAALAKPMPGPSAVMVRAGGILFIYAVAALLFLGSRPDMQVQLARPLFAAEVLLLLVIALSSLRAALYLSYPDHYQKSYVGLWPCLAGVAFVLLLAVQMFLPVDARMVLPVGTGVHGMECTLCIASVAAIPSALLFMLIRKGASTHPFKAGCFVTLTAASIGCLTLRLAEVNDSLVHLVQWHYLPTLLFAALGAWLGKYLLAW